MSAFHQQAGTGSVGAGQPGSAGRRTADGKLVYRMVAPLVVWWGWALVAVLSLGDLAIQGRDYFSVKFALGLLTATGLVYACTLWPKVIADDDGISVVNPFRRFDIPWAAVRGIFLADSVEVRCARLAPRKDKTVYSWALPSPRRARARAELRGSLWDRNRRSRPSEYQRLPDSAKEMTKAPVADVMARELARMSEEAKARLAGQADGASGTGSTQGIGSTQGTVIAAQAVQAVMTARWAWQPVAAVLVPGVAFAIAQLVR